MICLTPLVYLDARQDWPGPSSDGRPVDVEGPIGVAHPFGLGNIATQMPQDGDQVSDLSKSIVFRMRR